MNDVYGHETGDRVLAAAAKAIRENCRGTDTAARWGGEEFIVLMPDTNEENAKKCADKLRRKVAEIVFTDCPSITISAGVSQFRMHEKFDCWFKRADAALYHAKKTGRDKVVMSTEPSPDMLACSTNYNMLSLYLEWRSDYITGEERTDDQHRTLFETANRLLGLIVNKASNEKVAIALDDLAYDVAYHFADEEKYLAKNNCPAIDFHRSEHHRLEQTLKEYIAKYKANETDAFSFIPFICQELVLNHIVEIDLESFRLIQQ